MAKPPFNPGRRHWLQSLALMPIVTAAPARAQQLTPTPAGPPCRIGFIRHYEPFSFLDDNDLLIGFDVDVSRRLCQLLGRPMQIVAGTPSALQTGLQTGALDWLGNQLLITPDNRRKYDFVQPAYANIQLSCVQHEDDQRDFLSLDDLVGKRLGVLAGTGVEEQATWSAKAPPPSTPTAPGASPSPTTCPTACTRPKSSSTVAHPRPSRRS